MAHPAALEVQPAMSKVLDTTELLEAIFLHIPPRQLLETASRVNKTFKATIDTSPRLQERLCFRPPARSQSSPNRGKEGNIFASTWIRRWLRIGGTTVTSQVRDPNFTINIDTLCDEIDPALINNFSISRMYITNKDQPLQLDVSLRVRTSRRCTHHVRLCAILRGGLTVGQVFRVASELYQTVPLRMLAAGPFPRPWEARSIAEYPDSDQEALEWILEGPENYESQGRTWAM